MVEELAAQDGKGSKTRLSLLSVYTWNLLEARRGQGSRRPGQYLPPLQAPQTAHHIRTGPLPREWLGWGAHTRCKASSIPSLPGHGVRNQAATPLAGDIPIHWVHLQALATAPTEWVVSRLACFSLRKGWGLALGGLMFVLVNGCRGNRHRHNAAQD